MSLLENCSPFACLNGDPTVILPEASSLLGEKSMYWLLAAGALVTAFLVVYGLDETTECF